MTTLHRDIVVRPFPAWAAWPIRYGVTTRHAQLDDGARAVGIEAPQVFWPQQVHGAAVVRLHRRGQLAEAVDGILCDAPGVPFGIRTADCAPLFFYAPRRRRRAVGASSGHAGGLAHVGWRGLAAGLPGEMVRQFSQRLGVQPAELWVGIGPRIGGCCYEVGQDLVQMFNHNIARRGGQYFLDIPRVIQAQLTEAGVAAAQITDSALCTSCANELFFSVRREGPIPERVCSLMQLAERMF